ncbi:uncharacterized protein LOC131243147 isoform X2 [Magnolia sinica]|uniref:uncharacterized protein LOC131243147 isoform X2 n=1 Tax=Magnolia sinica TaxID=86752 RepID=UPI00265B1A5F|nr:uncharacterized protein LOC131243147 isoform X2 [Magnolia sinica]
MALLHSIIFTKDPQFTSFSGSSLKPMEQYVVNFSPASLSISPIRQKKSKFSTHKRPLTVRAGGDGGRSASIFVGGFVLGGIIVGTLGCVYAPQISKALAGADRKDLMRKLPKFIYDEEKALEKTRKILTEKIAQLNSAIDDVSSQLRSNDGPNGAAVASDEIEAAI